MVACECVVELSVVVEWSGQRGEVYDFGGLGCSQRLPLSV